MLTAEVVVSLIRFAVSSVTELPAAVTAIRAVHRNWNVDVFRTAARLFFSLPYDVELVCNHINFVPPQETVNWMLVYTFTETELPLTWDENFNIPDFIQVLNAQVILQHLVLETLSVHEFCMRDLLDVFVCAVGGMLDHRHPFVREAVTQTLDIDVPYDDFLDINIMDNIQHLRSVWRETQIGPLRLSAIVECFYRYHIWLPTWLLD